MYGNQGGNLAGMTVGIDLDIESKVVASGAEFSFGEGVFVDEGDADTAFEADVTDTSLKFLGVAVISHRSYDGSEDKYIGCQEINVLSKGMIYVPVSSGLSAIANLPAYLTHSKVDANYGNFTTSSASTYDIGGYFRSNVADGVALVELRGLK